MPETGGPEGGIWLPAIDHPRRRFGAGEFDFERQVAVMAIINRTPDSFHDKGATFAFDKAVAAAERAVADGADWLDIGGVPFLEGPEVGAAEEADRVVPLVEEVRRRTDVVISVDTFRPEVARAAIAAGADVVNDTSGFREPELARVVAETGAGIVITHSLAGPRVRLPRPTYGDVTAEVVAFLRERRDYALSCGVRPEQIVIDPGHDLNKNTFHSFELTRRLHEVSRIGPPVLVALSNKDFIGEILEVPSAERLEGSLAVATACVLQGARIVRVHDVKQTVAAMRTVEAVMGWREPRNPRHNYI